MQYNLKQNKSPVILKDETLEIACHSDDSKFPLLMKFVTASDTGILVGVITYNDIFKLFNLIKQDKKIEVIKCIRELFRDTPTGVTLTLADAKYLADLIMPR